VGGNAYGEVAARLACTSIAEYFSQQPTNIFSDAYFNAALQYSIQQFKITTDKYPETKNMATTVALLALSETNAVIGWLGDSRVYHIRQGQILYVTEDHSLQNELAKKGADTTKVGRHIITKSLNATAKDDFELHYINRNDIQLDDFFFLCTDGVLENMTDELLCRILHSERTFEEKCDMIFLVCDGKTKDNFTFILIKIV
jgi:protein phosphatase